MRILLAEGITLSAEADTQAFPSIAHGLYVLIAVQQRNKFALL